MKIITIGNCQAREIASWIAGLTGLQTMYRRPAELINLDAAEADEVVRGVRAVFAMPSAPAMFLEVARTLGVSVYNAPRIFFGGFHPDAVYPNSPTAERRLPLGNCNSAILLHAWRCGLSPSEARRLFNEDVYRALGYREAWAVAMEGLEAEGQRTAIDLVGLAEAWRSGGNFMHQPLHPHGRVFESIARALLQRANIEISPVEQRHPPEDGLATNAIFPVYPEIGRWLDVEGDYMFRPKNTRRLDIPALRSLDLYDFIEASYAVFRDCPPELDAFPRLNGDEFRDLEQLVGSVRSNKSAASVENPYKAMPDKSFWRRAVTTLDPADVDPMSTRGHEILPTTSIVTAGSCFAQHLARNLRAAGYRYLVTENPPAGASEQFIKDHNYGVFSARYGNVYTTRQLTQLVDRTYGRFTPSDNVWRRADGRYLDPFRPEIQVDGFASAEEVHSSRRQHFAAVRDACEQADIFIFTLGMTEAWRSTTDDAIVPLAPGVVGAVETGANYVPVSFGFEDVRDDLRMFVLELGRLNATARVILTVSPVPIIATHTEHHVLAASTLTKSILRVAAQACADEYDHVEYFPSYEVIAGPYHRGQYFEDDLRSVTREGVDHVMRLFMKHHTTMGATADDGGPEQRRRARAANLRAETEAGMEVVCDEEKIVANL